MELGKELSRRNNQLVAGTVVLIILIALGLSTLAIRPAYSAWQGTKSQAEGEPLQAIAYYSKALELDPENAEYHAALADLYKWMAYTSKTEAEKGQWLQKGILAINEASRYSPYTPEYQYRKAEIYFTAEEWVKAWEATEQLIKVQPLRKENYELLARGYLEAGLQFLRERDLAKGQELLEKCAQIDRLPPVKGSTTLYYYQGKALLLLGEYQRSETLLKRARNGSLSLRMNSDRLLYIINEKTGRQAENAKYKGILWMGAATQTDEYKEIHEILDSDMLKTAKNM